MDVAAYCSIVSAESPVITSNDMTRFYLSEKTNPHFESYIRLFPIQYCKCCNRFLFSNPVKILGTKTNAVVQSLHLDCSDKLCSMCYKYVAEGKMAPLSSDLNSLKIDNIPDELSCLNSLEKKLLAKIQVCMTLIILPGGQYAEKGLIVGLPQDAESLIGKLVGVNSVCTVHFEHESAVGSRGSFLIDAFKVIRGFMWLKSNNILYRNLRISDINFNNSNFFNGTVLPSNIQDSARELEHVTYAPVNYSSSANYSSSISQNGETLSESSTLGKNQSIWIPRNKATPVSVYEISSGEEQAFPWLFPKGKNGFTYPRPKSIQPSLYFRYRLYNRNAYWRKDIPYLLHAAISYDKILLKKEIGVFMKMYKGNIDSGLKLRTTAADVRSRNNNPEILQNSYMFMKHIRGTVAYFRNALYDLLAMFRCLGPPTLFMTLSADDLHWPELGMLLDNLSYEEAIQKQSFFCSMRSDPLMTAIHFDRHFTALMKFVVHGPTKPLGDVKDWFVRVTLRDLRHNRL